MKNNNDIILASNSPRRKEILEMLGYNIRVIPSDCDENISETDPYKYAMTLSSLKASSVAKNHPTDIVIGADTIVVLDKEILGKPVDSDDAFCMLKRLSGKVHTVITGVSICYNNHINTFYDETKVKMYENDDSFLRKYIESKDPLDKAGSYGIQGPGMLLVEKIDGDFYNVMGLPIAKLYRQLPSI